MEAPSPQRLLYETHMHTPLCKHATGEVGDYAAVAFDRGLRGVIVTCHNPMPDGFGSKVRMDQSQFGEYVGMVDAARQAWQGRIDVRLGIECDYFPGYEKWLERQIAGSPFHYVLGSVHPQQMEYKDAYWRGDAMVFFKQYYEHLTMAAETRLFDSLAHPDIVKNIAPSRWNVDSLLGDIRRCLDRVAATGMAMELNTSGVNKDLPEMNPGPAILREMAVRGIPVVIGADAHVPHRAGDGFIEAIDLLAAAGYQQVSYFLDRRRCDIDLEAAKASLAAHVDR
jgi:histidinol-phosphatase (PHP family)